LAKYQIVDSNMQHVSHIATHMRQADINELWAMGATTPLEALLDGLQNSEVCKTVMIDDAPAMMFGVVERTLLDRTGTIWMLGTNDIHKIKFGRREFIVMWRQVMKLVKGYHLVDNYVHASNETSIKWLEFMGFTFDEPAPAGLFGESFRRFEMRIQ